MFTVRFPIVYINRTIKWQSTRWQIEENRTAKASCWLGPKGKLVPRGGNGHERRLEHVSVTSCVMRRLLSPMVSREEIGWTVPRWNSKTCTGTTTTTRMRTLVERRRTELFFRVASFPCRCGRSLGIKFLGRSCDQVNMHFFFCPVHPLFASSYFTFLLSWVFFAIIAIVLSTSSFSSSSNLVFVNFCLCTRPWIYNRCSKLANEEENKPGEFKFKVG